MEKIIDPIPRELLKQELTEEKRLRNTNRGGNILYVCTAHDSPNVMQEIGRLREIAFRQGGGGTGFSVDIDRFDTMEKPCKQLVVWNPDAEEIIGGYRYLYGLDIQLDAAGQRINVNTATLKQLKDHPYIGYYRARAIVNLREREGHIVNLRQLAFLDEFTDDDIRRLEPYLSFE